MNVYLFSTMILLLVMLGYILYKATQANKNIDVNNYPTEDANKLLATLSKKYPKNKYVKFNARTDRYGSVALSLMRIVVSNIHNNNIGLFDVKAGGMQRRYGDSVLYQIMLNNSPNTRKYIKNEHYDINIRKGLTHHNLVYESLALYKQDLPSIIKELGLKDRWYKVFHDRALIEGWDLPTNKEYIVMHHRLDDLAHSPTALRPGISDELLNNIINNMKKKYPNHIFYIMTTKPDFPILANTLKTINQYHNVDIIGSNSNEFDKDLWIMMNSDILITSKSLFPFLSAVLHQGSQVYALAWDHLVKTGVFTYFDKSTWIDIEKIYPNIT